LSQTFDTIEEAIEYANEVFQNDEFSKEINAQIDAELDALEGGKPEAPKVETKVAPEKELSQEEKETFNPLAASLTVEQIEQGKKNKEGCVGVGKKKKEI